MNISLNKALSVNDNQLKFVKYWTKSHMKYFIVTLILAYIISKLDKLTLEIIYILKIGTSDVYKNLYQVFI